MQNMGVSLPQQQNGRFAALISGSPTPSVGQRSPNESLAPPAVGWASGVRMR